ncbi:hypothetical protein [Pedobacter miscanthi]|jgi:mono/diheme cytochrome c family protein|uniref:hypothetical protein n=1 Tax=Pedobacter miscanthi TaxID=2259170 RepID=UPI00292FB49D|nr:hypothetical protein [Pedobacter miscanthi]
MNKQISILFLATFVILLFACSKRQAEELKPEAPTGPTGPAAVTTANVTYTNFAGALFQTKCANCHGPNGALKSIWLFNGLASIKNDSRIANSVLVTKTMPKGGTLTVSERELLQAWFDKGMPE